MTTRTRILTASTLCLVALPALTGCGGTSSSSSSAAPAAAPSGAQGSQGGYGGQQRPGARGLVAEVDGSTAQVQSTSSQTAVTWSRTTTFRQTSTVPRSKLAVGSCVQVGTARPAAASSSSPTPSATPAATPSSDTAAVSVSISSAVNGACANPGAAMRRSGSASPRPSSSASQYRGFGMGTVGQVTAVTPSSFTVKPSRSGAADAIFTTTSATLYQQQVATTAAAVKVGQCLTAMGTTDSTGTLSARQVVLSAPVNGVCTTGSRGNR